MDDQVCRPLYTRRVSHRQRAVRTLVGAPGVGHDELRQLCQMCTVGAVQLLQQRELKIAVCCVQCDGAAGPGLESIRHDALWAGPCYLTEGDRCRKNHGPDRETQ